MEVHKSINLTWSIFMQKKNADGGTWTRKASRHKLDGDNHFPTPAYRVLLKFRLTNNNYIYEILETTQSAKNRGLDWAENRTLDHDLRRVLFFQLNYTVYYQTNKNDPSPERGGVGKCPDRGSNTGPYDLQSYALPTELTEQHINK